jgi:hypothetical protein
VDYFISGTGVTISGSLLLLLTACSERDSLMSCPLHKARLKDAFEPTRVYEQRIATPPSQNRTHTHLGAMLAAKEACSHWREQQLPGSTRRWTKQTNRQPRTLQREQLQDNTSAYIMEARAVCLLAGGVNTTRHRITSMKHTKRPRLYNFRLARCAVARRSIESHRTCRITKPYLFRTPTIAIYIGYRIRIIKVVGILWMPGAIYAELY